MNGNMRMRGEESEEEKKESERDGGQERRDGTIQLVNQSTYKKNLHRGQTCTDYLSASQREREVKRGRDRGQTRRQRNKRRIDKGQREN